MRIPFRFVLRSLLKHPVRSSLTAASLTIAIFLLCVLHSLVTTLDSGVKEARSDRLIAQSAVSLFVQLPEAYKQKIEQVDGVEHVCNWNWLGAYYQQRENFFAQFAVDETTMLKCYPEIEIIEGKWEDLATDKRACVIGEKLAKDYGWKLGDTVPLIGTFFQRTDGSPWEFQVVGIYRSRTATLDSATLWFRDDYLLDSLENGGAIGEKGISIFVAKVKPGYSPSSVMANIDAQFANSEQRVATTTEAQFQAQFLSMLGNIPFFLSIIGSGVVFAIFLAALNTMLMAAREQTKDSGVLKALGFSSTAVFASFLFQSLALVGLGGGVGLLLAKATSQPLRELLGTTFPNYQVHGETLVMGLALTLAIGLIAGIAPARRLARSTAVTALRTEN